MTNPLPPPPPLTSNVTRGPCYLSLLPACRNSTVTTSKNIQNLCWMDKIDCLVKLCNKTIVGITISAQTVLFNYFFYV